MSCQRTVYNLRGILYLSSDHNLTIVSFWFKDRLLFLIPLVPRLHLSVFLQYSSIVPKLPLERNCELSIKTPKTKQQRQQTNERTKVLKKKLIPSLISQHCIQKEYMWSFHYDGVSSPYLFYLQKMG